MKQFKINPEKIWGLQRRDSIQTHCLTLQNFDLPTKYYEKKLRAGQDINRGRKYNV